MRTNVTLDLLKSQNKKPLNVLSLFDGIAGGVYTNYCEFKNNPSLFINFFHFFSALVALKENGLQPARYYASEIDTVAKLISLKNHPEIIQVGDVEKLTEKNIIDMLPINLLIGGSPCTDLSLAKNGRQGLEGKILKN